MINDSLQWVAIIVEVLGLTLIAIELYFSGLAERLRVLLEGHRNDPDDAFATATRMRFHPPALPAPILASGSWPSRFCPSGIPAYSVIANVALTIVTTLILIAIWVSGLLVARRRRSWPG